MKFNEEIINTALLGTQKKELNTQSLPKSIQDITSKLNKTEKEAFFFQSMALLNQYYKGGNLEVMTDLPQIRVAEEETQAYISDARLQVFKKLIDLDVIRFHFWYKFLDLCIAEKQIIPPKYLVRLLNLGVKSKSPSMLQRILLVVGNRGKWLIEFNKHWQNAYHKESEISFYNQLVPIRKENPAKAREMLQESWDKFNTQERNLHLSILDEGLGKDDEAFLVNVIEQINQKKLTTNAQLQELRKTATTMLLRIPTSVLSVEIWDKFKKYIVVDKGNISLKLPKKPDDFFCKEVMWERLGLLEQSYSTTWYNDVECWAYVLLHCTPLENVEKHVGLDKKEILHQFNTNETLVRTVKKQTMALYTRAISYSAWNFRDEAWAKAWIEYFKDIYKIQENYISNLFYLHSPTEIEEIYMKYIKLNGADSYAFREVLKEHSSKWKWSEKFSVYVLENLLEVLTSDRYQVKDILNFLESTMHRIDINAFGKIPSELTNQTDNWRINNYTQSYRDFMQIKDLYELIK
ncbi:MAG: DUF5691 domain-containing protein [Raineya sp.]|jgi:hypothetical protein|nr:DUF5691 domain-containing protein [Raineya sp.]